MINILDRLYPQINRYSVFADAQIHALIDLPEHERSRIDLLQGHFAFGIHEHIPRNFIYFTVLREPVDRIISLYYYILRQPLHYLHQRMTNEGWSLEEFVERNATPETMNFQVGTLAGMNRWQPFEAIDEATLECAKRNLRDVVAAFGLTERFNETLVLFNRQLRWGYTTDFFSYTNKNVTENRPAREQIPERILNLIREKNTYDIQLYDYACQLFDERIRDAGLPFLIEHRLQRILRSQWMQEPTREGLRSNLISWADRIFGYI